MRRKSKGDREEARRRERSLRQRQDEWHVERLEVKQVGETYSAWEDLQATPTAHGKTCRQHPTQWKKKAFRWLLWVTPEKRGPFR